MPQLVEFLTGYGANKFHRSSDGVFFFTCIGEEYSLDMGEMVVFSPTATVQYPLYMDPTTVRELFSPQGQEGHASQGPGNQAGVQPA